MAESLDEALAGGGPHTVDSLAARLPAFPREAIHDALEALTAQGVLELREGAGGEPEYHYVAPDRYAQIEMDVVQDPARGQNSRR